MTPPDAPPPAADATGERTGSGGGARNEDTPRGVTLPSTVGHLSALTAALPDGYGLVLSVRDAHGLHRAWDHLVTRRNVEEAAQRCAQLAGRGDVYVSCTATTEDTFALVCASGRGKRGGADEARALVAVWADLDIAGEGHHQGAALPRSLDDVRTILDRLPTPSMVVGSGGGVHGWWLLADPLLIVDNQTRQRAARLADGWTRTVAHEAMRVGGWSIDEGVGELGRVLRVCGTLNHKVSPARRVTLLDCGQWPSDGLIAGTPWRPGPLYSVEELEARLDPLPRHKPTRPAPTSPRHHAMTGAGLLDAVRVMPWREVWPPGWAYVGEEQIAGETVELWQRPGASNPVSAKCWPDGGCRVWSDQVPGLASGDYSRAEVLAWRHGLTLSELAVAIGRQARQRVRGAA